MLLTFFSFLMRFVDISKLHTERCNCTNNAADDCQNKVKCWQQAAAAAAAAAAHKANVANSNSSSTSSGCDSNASSADSAASSSKENYYTLTRQRRRQQLQQQHRQIAQQQHQCITPEQLQQIRYYQQMQQQQLQLLQQQLLQRRRLQQHLREQGVTVGGVGRTRKLSGAAAAADGGKVGAAPVQPIAAQTSPALTCNQQYLIQQRLLQQQPQQAQWLQQQQQQQQYSNHNYQNLNNLLDNNQMLTENDFLNNNGDLAELFGDLSVNGYEKGQKFRRGMTEFSTNNDINNKSHLSQPLQNSPRHFAKIQTKQYHQPNLLSSTSLSSQQQQNQPHPNSPQHNANNIINQHFSYAFKQTHNNRNNQQTLLPLNSSANPTSNINSNNFIKTTNNTSSPTSAAQSPQHHYKNPLNSPNNSPFTFAYNNYGEREHQQDQQQQKQYAQKRSNSTAAATAQQHQLQQHLRSSKTLPILTQTQYQQHLNDLLLQQQHLQKHQQQLLCAKDADDELSEESLKQNVAIVLNNLDRYNNALRSIILNEQVSGQSSVLIDDSLLVDSLGGIGGANNNFLLNSGNTMAAPATPESDYNSNATTPGSRHSMPLDSNMLQQHQHLWLLDCDYRDGCGSGLQRSIFSSLSGSYQGDIIFYNDFSKKLDANLAEVDMESFRAEDILLHMPSYCKNMTNSNRLQQQSYILQHSNMLQLNAQQHACTGGDGGDGVAVNGSVNQLSQASLISNNELIDNSICKSELLFSPVKESHLSADSLDMDAYPENEDIILTCKANKDNYTIAFEGSVLYSDESFYAEPSDVAARNTHNFINLHSNLEDIVKRRALDFSMSRSEQAASAGRGKLQKSNTTQLQRYPSGNNNTAANNIIVAHIQHAPNCTVRKSRSLPNLREHKDPTAMVCSNILDMQQQQQQQTQQEHHQQQQQLNVSQAISTSNMECCKTSRNLLPMCQMPISTSNSIIASITSLERLSNAELTQQQLQQQQQHRHKHRCACLPTSHATVAAAAGAAATNSHNCPAVQKHAPITGSASSGSSNPPAFNLVKLFIKQKSNNSATDEQQMSTHTCMDVSSGCWPSSDAAGSSSSSSLEQRLRKKSMNDSGKGSALSRHDEDEEQLCGQVRDTCEAAFQAESHHGHPGHPTPTRRHLRIRNDAVFYDEDPSSSSSGSLTATNSPAHRRRSMPPRHPQLCQLVTQHKDVGTACSLQSSENSRSNSEQLTQVYVSTGTSSTTLERQRSRCDAPQPTVSAASSSEVISRSMQTSCGSLSTRSSLSDRFRFVPPSFLAKLNNLGEERQAPIYVIYPNYALPDLGFVKTNSTADVIYTPFNYKTAVGNNDSATSLSSLKKRFSLNSKDDEILKAMDYKHVVDWQSLTTLLPADYRRRLKHIPEVNSMLPELDAELSQRPLFCMSPPIRRNRPHICDCAQYFQQQQQQTQVHTGEEGSSSSASSQQPSSGYRGSSTLLADSADLENADPLKQMYIYQYEQQRMDSGVEMSPAMGKTPPQPMPRGILRKSSSHSANRLKRNSMIEGQQSKLSKQEKRRSLQEPPYHHHGVGSSEELGEVFEEEAELYAVPQTRQERLSRKDLDARMRFLSTLPRSELKNYAEIAAILESSTEYQVAYDPAALKKEVSRALSQQKKVSFNDIHTLTENEPEVDVMGVQQKQQLPQPTLPPETRQRFTTPPNSPNNSVASGRTDTVARRSSQMEQHQTAKRLAALDEQEKRKIESNRFKRLQIQWELMSKDSTMLKDLASAQETKSGGSTPTAAAATATSAAAVAAANAAHKSRIPRPVSYPAGKISTQEAHGKTTRSPSRIVPPKRYSMTAGAPTTTTAVAATVTTPTARARTPTSRAAVTAPNTPKRRVQSPRTISRVR